MNSIFWFTVNHQFLRIHQWSFCKTGTMGTLASQAEIGVWVGMLLRVSGISTVENCEIVCAKSCSLATVLAGKWLSMPSIIRI